MLFGHAHTRQSREIYRREPGIRNIPPRSPLERRSRLEKPAGPGWKTVNVRITVHRRARRRENVTVVGSLGLWKKPIVCEVWSTCVDFLADG